MKRNRDKKDKGTTIIRTGTELFQKIERNFKPDSLGKERDKKTAEGILK